MPEDFEYDKLTPMLKHYIDVKRNFKDAILLYRVGDFYETFFEDAIITSKAIQLTLTGKDCGHNKKAPMCGVPHHVVDVYINKLVKKGYKVALCDQVEDPKFAKGLVKRAITRVITPGTITDMDSLDKKENNYLLSVFKNKYGVSGSYCDISTGKLVTFEIKGSKEKLSNQIIDQIEKIHPSELLLNTNFDDERLEKYLDLNQNIFVNYIEDTNDYKEKENNVIKHLGKKNHSKIKNYRLSLISLSNLLDYIYSYHKENLSHINQIEILDIDQYMQLEMNTRKNLELHRNLNSNNKDNTVISILDQADTVMGSRLISEWLERPLINPDLINKRLDYVDYLYQNPQISSNLSSYLADIYDLERIVGKISYGRANARDLISLKNSIRNIPSIKSYLMELDNKDYKDFANFLPDVNNIYELLEKSIVDDPPIAISEGNIIKKSYNQNLDNLKDKSQKAESDLIKYENEEREQTGIKNLKIVFNKNNGYSIEITKSNIEKVPDSYIRKQTLKNQERYTTEKLEEISDLILGGTDKINSLEYELFQDIRNKILEHTEELQLLAQMIACLDAYNSLSKVAKANNYCRPKITTDNKIIIKDGRHPVIENNLNENEFIANDTDIGEDNNLIQIITGPNMAGKSTYMRQMAIIIILAQIGSFVPAKSASISICDKVFTRIGASDNISKGESTFMLEMNEVSNILKNSTKDSFIILDEVGRGTGSDDGLSIAMSLVEYLSKNKKVKTVFATHFHELTVLENQLDNVTNLKIDILEENNELIFLRKIRPGKSDRSYGIEVAKLSGLPNQLIENAKIFMEKIDNEDLFAKNKTENVVKTINDIKENKYDQLKTFANSIDINTMTPIESINALHQLINKIGEL
ncbi:MAG: DNA mismatch repair protein MutS [Peptoniphilaceae bacterium]|nr:DNA mismatch repair protein MutS [Peptoniphilaceae bacterium]MDY6019613.1 DNA mismatch repair protein MutS [Anaerococcus sp.]